MLGYIFEVIKDEIGFRRERTRRATLPPQTPETQSSPATPTLGMRILSPPPRPAPSTPPLKNWSHPFGDRANPLQQLTQLANAQAGYYPLGRNGMWHGGVHFDSGIAETEAHSQVRCLADGEVVAYRVPERTPLSTFYPESGGTLEAPFAAGFVLVRHHLQAPKIEGNSDEPPSLTFFSLYMHLDDWARYEADTTLQRPAFWPERNLRIRKDVTNSRPGTSTPRGLETLIQPDRAAHQLDLLPPDTPVVVSGEGKYRKLEHVRGPASLLNSDGSLKGYVAFRYLDHVSGTMYRVRGDKLRVRPTPDLRNEKLFELRLGTEITISGEGEFRKLESINQYVLAASLQGERAADTGGNVVLSQPFPIKAGELIGHLGPYQESDETVPQRKLHLEVFCDDDVEDFFAASRAWAERMPDKHKTWLKIAKGTPVVPHQEPVSATRLPMLYTTNPCSDNDLFLPKSLLDGLPPERKIKLPTSTSGRTFNWYHLEGLFHDAAGNLLDGWVREEVGVTPWVNPWSWQGYDVLYNYSMPQLSLSYLFSVTGVLGEEARDRLRDSAEKWDQGKLQSRLYEIIDQNRDGKMTADEFQAALRLPALAQSLAQLVIFSESEWNYRQRKWDALDEVLGHTNSAPILNWVAEKQRIKELSWWGDMAGKVGLPEWGKVFHFHPIGLASLFSNTHPLKITPTQLKQIFPTANDDDINIVLSEINDRLEEFKLNTRFRQRHFFSQIKGEVGESMKGVTESWEYSPEVLKSFSSYYRAHPNEAEEDGYLKNSTGEIIRRANQREIGRKHFQRLNGNRVSNPDDGYNLRGRGLIQITGHDKYHGYMRDYTKLWSGITPDTVNNPEIINEMPNAIRSALWFWLSYKIYEAERENGYLDVQSVTKRVNGGHTGLEERRAAYKDAEKALK